METRFKVGDKVQVKEGWMGHGWIIGKVTKIIKGKYFWVDGENCVRYTIKLDKPFIQEGDTAYTRTATLNSDKLELVKD